MVQFLSDGIYIEDKPCIILCSSVFYFRIPKEEWRDRLEKVKRAGYNCIDIYFPWNYHEMIEGNWDFSGQKDVGGYLALAKELGLWVIARPGPYICSEWDMGGLPAYLLTKKGLILRDYNEPYLECVKKWYDKIMPIIVKYQQGNKGSVIAVQIENELDFYHCAQVEQYIGALRDYTTLAGIKVPIVVCAGQCDIKRAGGLVEGVIPVINLYPDMQDKYFEDKVNHYLEVFQERNVPLCITETHQSHFIIRRELIGGAKFIAAYNQVSGSDFGFTTSVNNWGSPMTYMTHDYQFRGMINPYGECLEEYGQALLLGGLLKVFEKGISTGRSRTEENLHIQGECKLSSGINRTLALSYGGRLAAIANIDKTPGKVSFLYGERSRPAYSALEVQPLTCQILFLDIPLSELGVVNENGKLAYSTAEICHLSIDKQVVNLLVHTKEEGELAFFLEDLAYVNCNNMSYEKEGGLHIFTYSKNCMGITEIVLVNGYKIVIYGVSSEKAIQYLKSKSYPWEYPVRTEGEQTDDKIVTDNKMVLDNKIVTDKVIMTEASLENIQYKNYILPGMGEVLSNQVANKYKHVISMEEMNYYRGYGWYTGEIQMTTNTNILGYMLYNGMDILHLYRNGEYINSLIGDGTHQFIKEPDSILKKSIKLGVRCEIWGHSNFSDSRLPAMDIRSKKGIQGLAVITNIEDISENWFYCKDEVGFDEVTLLSEKEKYQPIINFASYNNPEQPQVGIYKKKIQLKPDFTAGMMELKGFASYGKVYVNGKFIKNVQPFDTTISLDYRNSKKEIEVAIYVTQKTIQESLNVVIYLYEGWQVKEVLCSGAEEKEIYTYINGLKNEEDIGLQPEGIRFKPGEITVLRGMFITSREQKKSYKLSIKGGDVKVLVLLNGKMMGRLWLPSEKLRPEFRGGDDSILYLPKSLLEEENQIDLLVEAIQGEPLIEKIIYTAIPNT